MDSLIQAIRYSSIGLGFYLVGHGTITAEQVQAAADQVATAAEKIYVAIGAIMGAGVALQGIYAKWNTKSVPAATAARIDVPTVSPVTGAIQR